MAQCQEYKCNQDYKTRKLPTHASHADHVYTVEVDASIKQNRIENAKENGVERDGTHNAPHNDHVNTAEVDASIKTPVEMTSKTAWNATIKTTTHRTSTM